MMMSGTLRLLPLVVILLAGLSLPSSAWARDCVGLIPTGWHHTFWHKLVEGGQQAAKDKGIKLIFRAPRQEGESAQQIKLMLSIRKHGCDAFAIAPIDNSINGLISSWAGDGVPTIFMDRSSFGESDNAGLIMTDNYQAGRDAAREMHAVLPENAVIALLGLKRGVTSTDARENGFRDFMIEVGRSISFQTELGVTLDSARWQAGEFFKLQGDTMIHGIFTPNESTTEGVIEILDARPGSDRPVHVGFDDSPKIRKAISAERLFGVIVQDPFQMGYQSVVMAIKARNGNQIPSRTYVPHKFMSKQSLTVY